MSVSNATVELTFKARNLADAAVKDLKSGLSGLASTGAGAARTLGGAFQGIGNNISIGLGMATETLATGGDLPSAAAVLGVFLAGNLVENLAGTLIEKLAGSTLITAIAAPLGAIGTAAGGLISAAIPVGMAALPVLLIGALVAVVAVLIANPEIRGKVIAFAQGLVATLINAVKGVLGAIVGVIGNVFKTAWELVLTGVRTYVQLLITIWFEIPKRLIGLGADIVRTIIGGLASFPGRLADVIRNAFASLRIDVGPFHITGRGITVDLPKIDVPNIGLPSFAVGSRNVPADMLAMIHKGEMIIPASIASRMRGETGGGAGAQPGYVAVAVSIRDLARAVDGEMYFRVVRSAASIDRS